MFSIFVILLLITFTSAQLGQDASSLQCGPNAEFVTCGTACPQICNDNRGNVACIARCIIGCQCKYGFIRHSKTYACVLPQNC